MFIFGDGGFVVVWEQEAGIKAKLFSQ